MKNIILLASILALTASAANAATCTTPICKTDGEITVNSGGAIVVEEGGSLTVAGVTIDEDTLAVNDLTATGAELNYNDITTLGTLAASKTWTSDASLDTVMPTGGLLTVQSGGAVTFNSGSTLTVGGTFSITGTAAHTGDVTGDGGDQLVGFLNNQVAATATTITAAQCGSTFISGGAIEMELPEASTVLGCRLTFVVNNASNFTIDPDAADIIQIATNAAGDSLIADLPGESITIEAITATQWAVVGTPYGTWTDSN